MVVAGNLEIKGSLDTSDIDRGARDVNTKLDSIKQKGQSTNGSLSVLSKTTAGLATTFLKIGTVGVGALGALASKSPQLADEFARIQVESFKLSNTLGGVFEPIFQEFEEGFSGFSQAVSDNEGTIKSWVDFGIVVAKGALSDLGGVMDTIKEKYDEFDKAVEEKTGGTSFTEEFTTQVTDVKKNISEKGLTGGITQEVFETKAALQNLVLNSFVQLSNGLFGTDFGGFNIQPFNPGGQQTEKDRLFYNTDTVGD